KMARNLLRLRKPAPLAQLKFRAPAVRWRLAPCLVFPARTFLFGLGCARSEALEINFGSNDVAHLLLQFVHGKGAIQNDKVIAFNHVVIAFEDTRLEKAKTFGTVIGEAEIHSGLVVLQLRAATEDAVNGYFERRAEIKGNVRDRSKAIKIAEPFLGAAACAITSERRVNVTVGEN